MAASLTPLIEHTYIRTDVVYRLSLIGEFLDFVFFTDGATVVTKETFTRFATQRSNPKKDNDFLQALSSSFWEQFTRDSFQQTLIHLKEELSRTPIIPLTIPVDLSEEYITPIGKFVRTIAGENMLVDVSIDPTLATGCQFVWKDQMHDFSFTHYVEIHRSELTTQLSALLAPSAS